MALLLNPRVWIGMLIIAALSFGGFTLYRAGQNSIRVQWDAERSQQQAAMQAQKDRNIELQRAAEKKYVVQSGIRDHYITQTITEIAHEAAPMASCPVPTSVRVRLNAAAKCASSDSPASCGADGKVPSP